MPNLADLMQGAFPGGPANPFGDFVRRERQLGGAGAPDYFDPGWGIEQPRGPSVDLYGSQLSGGGPQLGPSQAQPGGLAVPMAGAAAMFGRRRPIDTTLPNLQQNYWAPDREDVLGWGQRFAAPGSANLQNLQQNYWAPDREQVLQWAGRFPSQQQGGVIGGRGPMAGQNPWQWYAQLQRGQLSGLGQLMRGGGLIGAALGAGARGGGMVMLRAPTGETQAVPADQVQHYLARGAQQV